MELLQGRNQGELRTVQLDLDDQSTSYTVRQRTPAQKNEGESTSPRRGIRSYLRSAIDGKEISAQSIYDDLIRKSDVLPPYINLLQAASTYNRVRSSDFDFISVSLTTAFFFERNVRRIGRGATFQVYRWPAENFPRHYGIPFSGPESARSTGDFVALKSISRLKRNSAAPTEHTERAITNFIKELQVLGHPPLRAHPNIPNLLGVAWEDGADGETVWPVICVDYAAYGTLAELQRSRAILTALEKNRVLLDIGIGMEALHMCGIVHGDLKAGNVLIFPHSSSPTQLIAKISDFADVWIIKDNPEDRKVMVSRGTVSSCSPEFESELPCNELARIDFYCYGLLVWRVLLDGQDPFDQPFQRLQQLSSQVGDATNSYRRFVLDVKRSEQVLEWALDFSASLEAKGSNSAGIAKVFKLTLQREPNKRSRVWKTVYDHLKSNFDAQDERLCHR
jgi:serine/threonine protein kinase